MIRHRLLHTLAAGLLMSLYACSETPAPETPPATPALLPEAEIGIRAAQWQQQANDAMQQSASAWQTALDALQQAPSNDNLTQTRAALQHWAQQFNQYYLLFASRACQLDQLTLLARIDSGPLYPGYLDSLPQWPESGLINDTFISLDHKTLRIQHGATDRSEASLGFSALFTVLNGADTELRDLSAFIAEGTTAPRRLQYLALAGEQLASDISHLHVDTTLTADALRCGTRTLLAHHHSIASAQQSSDDLWLPAASTDAAKALLSGIAIMAQATLDDIDQQAPPLSQALQQARNDNNWQALQAWAQGNPSTD